MQLLTCGTVMEQILPKRTCPERAKMMMFLNEVNHITHSKSATSCRSSTRHFTAHSPTIYSFFLPIFHPKAPKHFSSDVKPQEGRAEVAHPGVHKAEHPQPLGAGIFPATSGTKNTNHMDFTKSVLVAEKAALFVP